MEKKIQESLWQTTLCIFLMNKKNAGFYFNGEIYTMLVLRSHNKMLIYAIQYMPFN